ncbi:hypothetical protein [Virgisporangium aurantiacum]|uniref:Uncharacterized protein n=1 Tax=Virgisporangium aurantiacum TaxID=175570 RepID=A0A8J4DZX9_9ACTN|nr:hypothetical protein [Virgisporangium aurantiacum]GIJ57190.1 hypothetical protein Vau01_047060 [Virgisporangium aurantiacum]
MQTLRSAAVVVLLATAALFQLPAGPAAASVPIGALDVEERTISGATGSTVRGTVSCPENTFVINAQADSGFLGSLSTQPDQRTVEVVGRIISGHPFNFMFVRATCLPVGSIPGMFPISQLFPAGPANTLRTGAIFCPLGFISFAGGGRFVRPDGSTSTDASRMVSNAPSGSENGRGWTFGAQTANAGDRFEIRTMCAPAQGGFVKQNHRVPPRGESALVRVECPSGFFAIAGGPYLSKPDGTESPGETFVSEQPDLLSLHVWDVGGTPDSQAVPGTKVVSVANCMPSRQ